MMIKIINVKNFLESYFLREFNLQFSKLTYLYAKSCTAYNHSDALQS